jgi:hypothetical protein
MLLVVLGMSIQIRVFSDDFRRAYSQLTENARQEVRAGIVEWCMEVCETAKANHAFQNRTGMLEASIDAIVWGGWTKIIADCPYAWYVYFSHGSWEGDPFLMDAIDDCIDDLPNLVIDRLLQNVGV